jgi:hypothetical protein
MYTYIHQYIFAWLFLYIQICVFVYMNVHIFMLFSSHYTWLYYVDLYTYKQTHTCKRVYDNDDVYLRLQHEEGFHNLVYMSHVKHINQISKAELMNTTIQSVYATT